MTIYPYWTKGTWCFDDPQTGLKAEAFVFGADQLLTDLVRAQDIPRARQGFRLTFDQTPFAGLQDFLLWVREEGGWNVYTDGHREAWLCPALLKYFETAPHVVYVRVDALSPAEQRRYCRIPIAQGTRFVAPSRTGWLRRRALKLFQGVAQR